MKRLAAMLLERVFGCERGVSIVGDLEEDLTHGRTPRWASALPGAWLLWQAIAYVTAAQWADRAAERTGVPRSRTLLELTTMVTCSRVRSRNEETTFERSNSVRTSSSWPAVMRVASNKRSMNWFRR